MWGISVRFLSSDLEDKDRRRLQREVLHSRGEILFSKALVLCEGETEEQALPLLFKKYFDSEPFEMGISFVGIGGSGKKYLPFFTFGRDFDIPLFIFSDGDDAEKKQLKN
jgi:putative ATP-dependent endonuclease of OLD family